MNEKTVVLNSNAITGVNFFASKNIVRILLLLFSLQIPSLPPIFKYVHVDMLWFVPFYMIVIGIFYHCLFLKSSQQSQIQKILNSHFTMFFLFTYLLLITLILYRHELALQAIGQGTDSGPCAIVSGLRLLHGKFPYLHLDYLRNPISAGPGWVMLMMPFSCTGLYGLLIPTLVIASTIVIKKITRSNLGANIYLLCLLSSPGFMNAMVVGNDYVAIGIVYGLVAIALFYYYRKNWLYDLCFMIGVGMLATARLNFWYLAPLFGFFIWGRNKKDGVYFALAGLLVTILLHLGFYLWNPQHYAPLHVIKDDATPVFGGHAMIILLCVSVISGIIAFLTLKNTLKSWLFLLWICLTAPLFVVGIFALIQTHWDLQGNGFSYLIITAPILTMWLGIEYRRLTS